MLQALARMILNAVAVVTAIGAYVALRGDEVSDDPGGNVAFVAMAAIVPLVMLVSAIRSIVRRRAVMIDRETREGWEVSRGVEITGPEALQLGVLRLLLPGSVLGMLIAYLTLKVDWTKVRW